MLTRADFATEAEWFECCACRRAWHYRADLTPSSLQRASKETWADWYAGRFRRPITEAATQYREMIRSGEQQHDRGTRSHS